MDYRDYEMTDLPQEENVAIDAKKFADMILEYDTKEDERTVQLMCQKWGKETSSLEEPLALEETFRKVYNFAKQFWDVEELKEKILTECFTDKEFARRIINEKAN